MKKKQNSNSRLIVNSVSRDKLWYDQFNYCYTFVLPELSALRELDHKHIDTVIKRRKEIENRYPNFGGSWMASLRQRTITDEMVINLHRMCDLLLAHNQPYKFTISGDTGHLYTNEFQICTTLHSADWLGTIQCRQVSLDFPRDSIYIKKSKHAKRTYFKNQSISLESKTRLSALRENANIRFGPGLEQWLDRFPNSKYVCDNYFIDHNDDSVLTMLHLATGIQIKKTLSIVRDK